MQGFGQSTQPDIIFCGEALIDFVPFSTPEGTAYFPKPGGSPFNAAKAAAMAGGHALFCGALSQEFFADLLEDDLKKAGVDTRLVQRLDYLTTLAFVDLSSGEPRYAFHDEATASRAFSPTLGLYAPPKGSIVDFGSVSLIGNPGADALADFAVSVSETLTVALDPNVRPGLISDIAAWFARIDRILDSASILKLSVEDLDTMAPDTELDDFASSMIARGLRLVVITQGEKGAVAFTPTLKAQMTAPSVDVCDTIGAGDTLMGVMLVWLVEHRQSVPMALQDMDMKQLNGMLEFGVTAASMSCTRAGCSPPLRADLDNALNGRTL